MEEKEREIKIGKSAFYMGEDNILSIVLEGEINDEIAEGIRDIINKYADSAKEKISVLCDLNKAGKSTVKARSIYKEILDQNRINKVAMYGLHPVAKMLASFTIGYLQINIARFFSSKEEALAWLMGKERR